MQSKNINSEECTNWNDKNIIIYIHKYIDTFKFIIYYLFETKNDASLYSTHNIKCIRIGVLLLKFGAQINYKFNEDGSPRRYPGNTVISDVFPENKAYPVIRYIIEQLKQRNLDTLFILLPEDSYHVTIIRGVNNQVRNKEFWPPALPLNASMYEADNFVKTSVESVEAPDAIQMRFNQLLIDEADFRICLEPANYTEDAKLRDYRNKVAQRLGLWLPGHDSYIFHITVAYTLFIPDDNKRRLLDCYTEEMNMVLKQQDSFMLPRPRLAYYNDMLHFFDTPIERNEGMR